MLQKFRLIALFLLLLVVSIAGVAQAQSGENHLYVPMLGANPAEGGEVTIAWHGQTTPTADCTGWNVAVDTVWNGWEGVITSSKNLSGQWVPGQQYVYWQVTVTWYDKWGHKLDSWSDSGKIYRPDCPVCVETTPVYGEWSPWQVDPNDPSKEFRTRTVTYKDANDPNKVCGTEEEREERVLPPPWPGNLFLVLITQPTPTVTPTPVQTWFVCYEFGDPAVFCEILSKEEQPRYLDHPKYQDSRVLHPTWPVGWNNMMAAQVFVVNREVDDDSRTVQFITSVRPGNGEHTEDGGYVFYRVEPALGFSDTLAVVTWTPILEVSIIPDWPTPVEATSASENIVQPFVDDFFAGQ